MQKVCNDTGVLCRLLSVLVNTVYEKLLSDFTLFIQTVQAFAEAVFQTDSLPAY